VGNSTAGDMTISTGGTVSNTDSVIGYQTGSNGTVTVNGGTWTNSSDLYVGLLGNGSLSIDNGTVSNGGASIGGASGSTGTVTVSGGNWTNADWIVVGDEGTGRLHVSGGTVTSQRGLIGYGSSAVGAVTMSGGNWTIAESLSVGIFSTGSLDLSGGTVSARSLFVGGSVIFTGGVFAAGQVHETNGNNGTVTFNGGTLRLTGNQTDLFTGFESGDVTLVGAGGTIDTDTYRGGIACGLSGNGSLTKQGSGMLTLNGNNTYTGGTTVETGMLLVNGSTGNVTVSSGGTLGGNGTVGAITLNGGELAPGNSPGTLTADSLVWTDGLLAFELGTNAANSDSLALTGSLSGSGGIKLFTFVNNGWSINNTYDLINFTSSSFSSSRFGFTNLGGFAGDFGINDTTLQFTVTAVPEPSTYALLALGGVIIISAIRRRRANA